MTTNNSENDYLMQFLRSTSAKRINRIGYLLAANHNSFALQAIRESVPTYSIASLKELRVALSQEPSSPLYALDIRELDLEDTALFAQHLSARGSQGLVYVLTPEQFAFFDSNTFDFVYR